MSIYNLILNDLQIEEPRTILPSIPLYDSNSTVTEKVKTLHRQLMRAKRLHSRKEMVIITWYLGQVIETQTDSPSERTTCLNLLTEYYRRISIRVYYLFEFLGVSQIEWTKDITLAMIRKLKQREYDQLRNEALTIAGARL